LNGCQACLVLLSGLTPEVDRLVAGLRQPLARDPFLEEPGGQRALARFEKIGLELFPLTGASPPAARSTPPHEDGMPPGDPRARDLPPGQLGQYRLLGELGHGGMGHVYKALHVKLQRVVALKVLSAERVNEPAAVARFQREMAAIGRLDHPNIVRATD